jgi:hypothetical protein
MRKWVEMNEGSSLPLSPFLSVILTTSLPPFFPSSSSLPLSLLPLLYFSPSLLSSSYYLSPFFLSLLLTASLPPGRKEGER